MIFLLITLKMDHLILQNREIVESVMVRSQNILMKSLKKK